MRRRLREQPRVVAAQVLLGLVLVAGGFALGRTTDDDVPASTATALAGARSDARAATLELREARGTAGRLNARVARERRRSASLRRRARTLGRSLRRTRRALARARRP